MSQGLLHLTTTRFDDDPLGLVGKEAEGQAGDASRQLRRTFQARGEAVPNE